MAQSFSYQLTFGGVPFTLDVAKVFRQPPPDVPHGQVDPQTSIRKHQPNVDLLDEINRLLPMQYLQDFATPGHYQGRNLGAIARQWQIGPMPDPQMRIGDWYYPTGASRWSVFRGLATSTMVREMLIATAGGTTATFVMQATPQGAGARGLTTTGSYTLSSPMYMLPPRPIGETAGLVDGLYLVTLVDERFYWQYNPVDLHITPQTTWATVINDLANSLGVAISFNPIPAVYQQPAKDSQLWCNNESAAIILDAVAYNVGCTVVRNLNGSYQLQTPVASQIQVNTNRGNALNVVRLAGGDMFSSGTKLPVGDLTQARNFVLPTFVDVSFPLYVMGDDPVPHFLNPRTQGPQPSSRWYEQSYGDVYVVPVPLLSGSLQFPLLSGGLGLPISGATELAIPTGQGLVGVSGTFHAIHDTAKALISGEVAATPTLVTSGLLSGVIPTSGQFFSGSLLPIIPLNQTDLVNLAIRVASDYYGNQMAGGLDEVYPGTFIWQPEGVHDIIWTYSERARLAGTRVMRSEWNQIIRELQHSTPPCSGYTGTARGVGGVSVAQTWRDSASGSPIISQLTQTFLSGDLQASISPIDYLPTQNRWWGQVDNEVVLFEGTSGGVNLGGGRNLSVVFRGANQTIETDHNNGASVTYLDPNVAYGVNLVTHEKGQFIYPGLITSGGISEARQPPQTQTVMVQSASGVALHGVTHWSGTVNTYDTTLIGGKRYQPQETVWVVERNGQNFQSGSRYDGQFVGYSNNYSGVTAPIYLANIGGSPPVPTSGPPTGSGTQLNIVTNVCCQILNISGTGSVASGTNLLTNITFQLTPIFFSSGSILGGPTCANCPNSGPACCPSSSGSAMPCFELYCGCPVFPTGMSQMVSFTASGFLNGTCPDCEAMNSGTFILGFEPGATCCWTSNDFPLCEQQCFWQLCTDSTGTSVLSIQPGNILTYQAAPTTPHWDGQSALTLQFVSSIGACDSNAPPSITVTPYPNTTPCSGCPTTVSCCSGLVIPQTLNAFVNTFGACQCLNTGGGNSTLNLTLNTLDGVTWTGTFQVPSSCCEPPTTSPCPMGLSLTCGSGNNWLLCSYCGDPSISPAITCTNPTTLHCQPFDLQFTTNFGNSPGDCTFCTAAGGPIPLSVTVTF